MFKKKRSRNLNGNTRRGRSEGFQGQAFEKGGRPEAYLPGWLFWQDFCARELHASISGLEEGMEEDIDATSGAASALYS